MSTLDKSPAILRDTAPTPSATPARLESTQPSFSTVAKPTRRLWLCIYLSALSLQALSDKNDREATAVFEDEKGMRRILLADKKARAAAVVPGLAVNAALALLPTLRLKERSLLREREALESLAAWAFQFTSFVCIEAPNILLLEIAGSLQLFGGLTPLKQQIRTHVAGYDG